jgi:LacI family transcriptional regulator
LTKNIIIIKKNFNVEVHLTLYDGHYQMADPKASRYRQSKSSELERHPLDTSEMKNRITIKDIAKVASVSATAVSMALNNRPGVSPKTRQKIFKIAKKLKYQPNFIARSLVSRRSFTIGFILNSITDPFFPELAKGIEEYANQLGYNLLLCNTERDLSTERKAIRMLRSKGVDGIILATVLKDDPNILPLIEDEFPFVLVNRHSLDPAFKNKINYVVLDNYRGGYLGMEHLYRLGHDRIAIVTGNANTSTAMLRTKGSLKALSDYGGKADRELIVEGKYQRQVAYEAAKKLMAINSPPTAYFAQDDYMAIGIREAVLDKGLRIPEDVALVGFDDTEIASFTGIDLTTISQQKYEMGKMGAKILIEKIEKTSSDVVNQLILKAGLIIRKSCGHYQRGYVR